MRYPVLILDHDDTVTDSTRHVHYPAFLDAVHILRPGREDMSLDEYFRINFDPGFLEYCEDELKLTSEELDREYEIWQSWVRKKIPAVFDGMKKVITEQKRRGGLVCVVSHSMDFNIRRDYIHNGLPVPDFIYGWEQPKEKRKPSVWPIDDIRKKTGCARSDMLMVDDLKPGYDMAAEAGIDFAAALWAHDVPEIRAFMQKNCSLCFTAPEQLYDHLFGGE